MHARCNLEWCTSGWRSLNESLAWVELCTVQSGVVLQHSAMPIQWRGFRALYRQRKLRKIQALTMLAKWGFNDGSNGGKRRRTKMECTVATSRWHVTGSPELEVIVTF
ncbi:hypothetical protein DEO72_LG9g2036 [Vigna unguiculata]|uniref:Uncharacterized protein n=1 Tax=Vigna unguiculata TaxID=3917 RepID=A0A4D6N2E2_VIGUN|nr:hypothetical protein DEO72_LG9g2036 [Vigna unguiculata]